MRTGVILCCDYECVAPPSAEPPANPCDNLECGEVCSTNGGTVGGGGLSFRRRLQGFSAAVMQYCQPDGSCGMNAAPQCDNGGGASEIDPRCPPSDPFAVGICMYDPTCDTAGRCESQGMICCEAPCGGMQCINPPEEPEPEGCTLRGGEEVEHGWSGDDTGNNYCNGCSCNDGALNCTRRGCQPRDACDGEEMCCPTGSTCMRPRGGQTRQCVMPTDGHMEPVPCGETSEPEGCTLRGGESVEHGWSGNDTGNNYCNTCNCNDGRLGCTKRGCDWSPAIAPRTCTLTGGEEVREGWSGDDTGSNHCNSCNCENGNLACTEMFCGPPQRGTCGEDLACGDVCASSQGMLMVMQYCQPDNSCAPPVVDREQCNGGGGDDEWTCDGETRCCPEPTTCMRPRGPSDVLRCVGPADGVEATIECGSTGDADDLCADNPFIGLSKRQLKQHRDLKNAKKLVKKHSKLTGQLEEADGRQTKKINKKIGKLNRNGQYDEAALLVAQSKAAKQC